MIKIIYESEPTHFDFCAINEPCTKNMTIAFEEDANSTDILNEVVKLLKYAGYSYIDRKSALIEAIETMCYDGVVTDDLESQEN